MKIENENVASVESRCCLNRETMIKQLIVPVLWCIALCVQAQPALRLPSVIGNHAVLQQSSPVKLWGWAPGSWPVKISCSWNPTDTVVAQPGKDCSWSAVVNTPKAGGPYTITFISDKQRIEIDDILTGEVWLCSGQSNMEFNFTWSQGVLDAGDAVAQSANKSIRFFQVTRAYDHYPQANCQGEWMVCSPETVAGMSAVGYFFGKKLNETTGLPVGLIASYWGGSAVQTWIPQAVLEHRPELAQLADKIQPVSWAPTASSLLYNGMIAPVAPYRMAGVIWYQGEANTDFPQDYGALFTSMITGWREAFRQELPFYYVQIAPCSCYSGLNGALLREQQETALALPQTGMITVGDLVDNIRDIHPKLKKEVGNRLANMVLKERYAKSDIQPYAPRFAAFKTEKNRAVVSVTSVGRLTCKTKTIANFQLAGDDRVFYPAVALLDKMGHIVLTAKEVKAPVAVRYCFTNDAMPGLFDVNGLPLVPFRTDKW
jgi:sialate O-acetylesterase